METAQMDQQAINLAKSIRQVESGGDFNAKGKSGESGAYQWIPATWKAHAKEALGDENAQMTPSNQNAVAYTVIKKWKDNGLNPAQIAAKWNSGSEKGWENKVSTGYGGKMPPNKAGVEFNVPKYVKSVTDAYQTIKGGGNVGIDPNNPSSVTGTQTSPKEPAPYGASFPATGQEGIVEGVAKGIGNIPSSALNLAENIGNVAMHPIKTAQGIGNMALGGIEHLIPGKQAQEGSFDALIGSLKDRYGSIDALKKTAINDPTGLALDVATILQGGGAAIKGASLAGKAEEIGKLTTGLNRADKASYVSEASKAGDLGKGAQIGQAVGDVGKTINPINVATKATGGALKLAGKGAIKMVDIQDWARGAGVSKLTPERMVMAFIANNFGGLPAAALTYMFEPTVVKLLNKTGTLTGKGLIGAGKVVEKTAPTVGTIGAGLNMVSGVTLPELLKR